MVERGFVLLVAVGAISAVTLLGSNMGAAIANVSSAKAIASEHTPDVAVGGESLAGQDAPQSQPLGPIATEVLDWVFDHPQFIDYDTIVVPDNAALSGLNPAPGTNVVVDPSAFSGDYDGALMLLERRNAETLERARVDHDGTTLSLRYDNTERAPTVFDLKLAESLNGVGLENAILRAPTSTSKQVAEPPSLVEQMTDIIEILLGDSNFSAQVQSLLDASPDDILVDAGEMFRTFGTGTFGANAYSEKTAEQEELLLSLSALAEEREATLPKSILTGLPGEPLDRAALVVKIPNDPSASQAGPNGEGQSGINQADIVYEELVENGYSRFAAVFQSEEPEVVGPIRSTRSSDIELIANLGTPLFVTSGMNGGVQHEFDTLADGVLLSATRGHDSLFFRENNRPSPNDLMAKTADLRSVDAVAFAGTPTPLFEYRSETDSLPASALEAGRINIDFGNTQVGYQWNPEVEGWARTQYGDAHLDATGAQVAPENVIIQFTEYGTSAADPRSPQAITVGSGYAWVLTDGKMVQGVWTRESADAPTIYTTAEGAVIELTPGKTWVTLAPADSVTQGPALPPEANM